MKSLHFIRVPIVVLAMIFNYVPLPSTPAQPIKPEQKLQELVASMESQLTAGKSQPAKLKLVVMGFRYLQDGLPTTSPFGDFLTSRIEKILASSTLFELIPHRSVNAIIQTQNWQADGLTPVLPENLGLLAGADVLLNGRFEVQDNFVKLNTYLYGIQNRTNLAEATTSLEKAAIPADLELFAENWETVSFADLSDVEIDSLEKIELEVFLNHPLDNTYRGGDEIKIFVKPKKTCHVRVLHRDTQGKDTVLFPRKTNTQKGAKTTQTQDVVKANQTLVIPPDKSFKIVAVKPHGTERLKVMASTRPFGNIRELDVKRLRAAGTRIDDPNEPPAYGEKSVIIRITP